MTAPVTLGAGYFDAMYRAAADPWGFEDRWYERRAGVVGAHAVMAGRRSWLESEWAQPVPADLAARAEEAEAAGQTTVYAGWDGLVRGVFAVSDTVKPTSAEAIARLRGMGLRPVLLTGDNPRAATALAARVGIDEVIAQVLPAGKVDVVKRLQASGRVVAMVGDGVNDAAALAQADLALAMGTGRAAIEASDLTLVRGDLRAVPDAIRLSRRTLRTIKGETCSGRSPTTSRRSRSRPSGCSTR